MQHDPSDSEKAQISDWIKSTLESMDVECDDVFGQYVLVMVIGKKTMAEISSELEAFIGHPECNDFAVR